MIEKFCEQVKQLYLAASEAKRARIDDMIAAIDVTDPELRGDIYYGVSDQLFGQLIGDDEDLDDDEDLGDEFEDEDFDEEEFDDEEEDDLDDDEYDDEEDDPDDES